jgi:FAD/FMN-containing dehydrogenase
MSKIAQYLNEHLLGEVSSLASLRARYATDESVLTITPELVAFPKTTNDVRKLMRFSWQLAEKGHVLGVTPRGLGTDTTGGAIGSGVVLDTTQYLNQILYVAAKDKNKIVHVQPGVSLKTLHEALRWNGLTIDAFTPNNSDMTVGGAIAAGVVGETSGKYGTVADAIERMEVVLANGDLMETGRISKREVSKKQGEQTLEGEIYRRIDGILEDNTELIESLSSANDNTGYRIDQVRAKDGSLDLTPLFIGSQGTLGFISEIVLRTGFYNGDEAAVAVACESPEQARDVADVLRECEPTTLTSIDGAFYTEARARGKKFLFDIEQPLAFSALVYASFDDFGDKARERKLKRAVKALQKQSITGYTSDEFRLDDLHALRDVATTVALPTRVDETPVHIGNGAYVPAERLEDFSGQVAALAEKHHIALPLIVNAPSKTDWRQAKNIQARTRICKDRSRCWRCCCGRTGRGSRECICKLPTS